MNNLRLNAKLWLEYISPKDPAIDWEKSQCTPVELSTSQHFKSKLVFHEGQTPVVFCARYPKSTQRTYAEGMAGISLDDKGGAVFPVCEGLSERMVRTIVVTNKAEHLARCCVVSIEGLAGLPETLHRRNPLVGSVLTEEVTELLHAHIPDVLVSLGMYLEFGSRLGELNTSDSEAGPSGGISETLDSTTTPVESAAASTSMDSPQSSETALLNDDASSGDVMETPSLTPKQSSA